MSMQIIQLIQLNYRKHLADKVKKISAKGKRKSNLESRRSEMNLGNLLLKYQ